VLRGLALSRSTQTCFFGFPYIDSNFTRAIAWDSAIRSLGSLGKESKD
jgi:hypothetical protein